MIKKFFYPILLITFVSLPFSNVKAMETNTTDEIDTEVEFNKIFNEPFEKNDIRGMICAVLLADILKSVHQSHLNFTGTISEGIELWGKSNIDSSITADDTQKKLSNFVSSASIYLAKVVLRVYSKKGQDMEEEVNSLKNKSPIPSLSFSTFFKQHRKLVEKIIEAPIKNPTSKAAAAKAIAQKILEVI